MKKMLVWMLTAIIALPSMSVSAQNVAKVGTTEYATTAEAMDVWKTNGDTLTLLEDCTYDAMTTITIAKDAVLDLNGKALTWNTSAEDAIDVNDGVNFTIQGDITAKGTISFVSAYTGSNDPYMIYVAAKANPCTFSVRDVTIVSNFTNKAGYTISSRSANSKANFVIENVDIVLKNYVKYALYLGSLASGMDVTQDKFSNLSITYSAESDVSYVENTIAIRTKRPCTLENCRIDLSKSPSTSVCYGLYCDASSSAFTISGANTKLVSENGYTLSNGKTTGYAVYLNSCSNVKLFVNDGVFSAPVFVGGVKNIIPTITIGENALFSAIPPYVTSLYGKSFVKVGGDGEYKDYYKIADGAVYKFKNKNTHVPYETAAECFVGCTPATSTYVTVLTAATEQNDFEIPTNVNVVLSEMDNNSYNGTITNRGMLVLASDKTWDNCSIVNYGTLDLKYDAHYGDNFVLNNQGGTVSVTKGYFTARSIEQVRSYIPFGYVESQQENGEIRIISDEVFKVGTKSYADIKEALAASSETKPAVLQKDYRYNSMTVKGHNAFLDLNGKTLTLKTSLDWQSEVSNGSLTISNGTIICEAGTVLAMIGSADPTATNYSVLTIKSDVVVKQADKEYFACVDDLQNDRYGIVVNFDGTYEGTCPFYINGSVKTISDNGIVFNIGSTAKITANSLAYAAGYGIWTYEGAATTDVVGIEVRAGKFTMNGGSITCTADKPADDQFNGNGSTSQACAIAASQHSTQLPVSVVINGGELKAYTPIYQANSQNNPQESIDKVSVVVNNAKVYSTSKNIVWSANKRVVLNGGVYNLSPAAYVAAGKAVVENTDSATKDIYPYTIGDKATAMTTVVSGAWNDPVTWGADSIPTDATSVIIKHKVTIPVAVKAQVSGITVEEGGITVEGTLIIGNDGIAGITDSTQLVVKDGATMVISPVAPADKSQPLATVYKSLNIKHKDIGTYTDGENPYLYAHIGVPTVGTPAIVCDVQLFGRQWNTLNGWEEVSDSAMAFKGYGISAETTPSAPVAFVGTWVGNQDAVLSMHYQGFQFVANSWTAPIKADEVLNQVNKIKNHGAVEAAVKVYIPEKGKYVDINEKTLALPTYAAWQNIAPLQAFFLYANEATTMTMNYEQTVWNALLAQPESALQQIESEDEEVAALITLTAGDGCSDEVLVYEGEAFHSTKMFNDISNTNIYVSAETADYSTFGTENLEGTVLEILTNNQTDYTLSFTYTTGEPLCIKDMETNLIVAMTEGNTYRFSSPANATVRRFVITRKDVPSHMENVTIDGVKGIYTITGQYLGEDIDWNILPQGVYLIDGQKYIK